MPRARKQQPRLKRSPAPIPEGLPEERVEEEEARRIGEAVRALRERRGMQQVELSALSGLPLKQGVAVTGSVDQFGNVQPIGGVNEKIEVFF